MSRAPGNGAHAGMASALYRGTVRHRRRRADAPADFTHPLTLLYADLDELPRLLGGRLTRRRPGLVRVRPRDLHGRTHSFGALREALRATVAEQSGRPAPTGRIAVLTHPRIAGLCFNPVSFYYLFDPSGQLDAVVAEVTSTPWRERHAYVLRSAPADRDGAGRADCVGDDGERALAPERGERLRGEHAKAIRVSPFQPMAQRYRWTVSAPGERLTVVIANHADSDAGDGAADDRSAGGVELAAALQLTREPLTPASLRRMLGRHPAGTLRILGLIYGHALALKARGARVHGRALPAGAGDDELASHAPVATARVAATPSTQERIA